MDKPHLFVGSSKEAVAYARAIKSHLQPVVEVTVWDEADFKPGRATLENLAAFLPKYDFAVLLLTSDDLTESRGLLTLTPRDNIIFELGLFMGHLGRDRTFLVYSEDTRPKIPTDLHGITFLSFDSSHTDKTFALSGACDRIRREVIEQGAFNIFQSKAIINHIRMSSWKEIYSRATRLVMQAEERVRATSFGIVAGLHDEKLEYFETLAQRAAEQKSKHVGFMYKVVCSSDYRTEERDMVFSRRKEIFDRYGVMKCLDIRELQSDWGMELLVVDEKHMHISFQNPVDRSLALGLELVNAEEIVRPIATWYDECLFYRATQIDLNALK